MPLFYLFIYFLFFYYPPSSGIASCPVLGLLERWRDTYTWRGSDFEWSGPEKSVILAVGSQLLKAGWLMRGTQFCLFQKMSWKKDKIWYLLKELTTFWLSIIFKELSPNCLNHYFFVENFTTNGGGVLMAILCQGPRPPPVKGDGMFHFISVRGRRL